ncbi:hypothetical protein BDN70DRAFT_802571 [Pholiota conissans]|uniref:Virilizer N-terminal domain-containing protein n=1 Tax=Pholiota conissans TaxID=109636 RepID=A0A9P6CWH9_9AGAR|nr:hypothetical protein BDN70DRAFT_802571 [Pholiota conissans]
MGLLGWEVLRPHNTLAAVLYPAPVRVSSIRVFPTGAQPFSQSPDTVAITEPPAFFVDVLFNATIQPTSSQDSQEKRAAKNALAATKIAYAGESTEFTVDMGLDYATRLIIFRGDFEVISVAIYGEVVAELPPVQIYETRPLPVPRPTSISPGADVANSKKPTQLAEDLLSLLPSPPTLALVSRLIFSLKPEDEDWDEPDFPYLYSDLDDDEVSNLESLVHSVTRPIRDDIPPETLARFATKMHDYLGLDPLDDAYYTAKLLVKTSSQQTRISRSILQHLDLPQVFNDRTLEESTVYLLLDAAANIEIARYFFEDDAFFNTLKDMQTSPKTDKLVAKGLKRLIARIYGWQSFEHALTNPTGDFDTSAAFLKDIAAGEHSLGCWLECMLIHENLTSKLAETPGPSQSRSPPLLLQERHPPVSHSQFIAFVKALLGISAVLAALSWSDSIGNNACRERSLGLLVLWQGIDGYREVLNHCLLLRQLTKRLGWNKTDETPSKSGLFAERLLVGLAKDPQSMLREHVVETVLSLEPPFSFIEAEEVLEIGKLARVARDGLPSAVEELTYTSVRPFSLRRLRVLRVSMAIVTEELAYDDGELHVVSNFWNEKTQGIVPTLVSILVDISDDLNHHFTLDPIPRMNQPLSDLLFRTSDDLLHLLTRFISSLPLTGRDLRHLSTAIADIYTCSRIACERFTSSSDVYLAALNIRQTCPEVLRPLVDSPCQTESDILSSQIILRTLFNHASYSSNRDPVIHTLQAYDLIDTLLPRPPPPSKTNGETEQTSSYWPTMVFPKILPDLRSFWALLDAETRAQFIERLEELDNGGTNVGEWLLLEEMKSLSSVLFDISGDAPFRMTDERSVNLYRISNSIAFFEYLITSSTMATWTLSALSSNTELSNLLDSCLSLLLETALHSTPLTQVIRQLAKHASDFSPDIRFHILLLTLRNGQMDPSVIDALDYVPSILRSLPPSTISSELLRSEVGRVLAAYSEHAPSLKADNSEMLLSTLEWLVAQPDSKLTTLAGITLESFRYLCGMLAASLPAERQERLTKVEGKFGMDEDQDIAYRPNELPETLALPLQSIQNLLNPTPVSEPSTPKRGTKTPDILGVVISPPNAILRSPAATGLTKTYANNDFRQLRQTTSTRLNTSRLPSTHGQFLPP